MTMARGFDCIIELDAESARRLIQDLVSPKPDPARDANLERIKRMKFEIR